jgi:hypothetical protein
MEMNEQKITDNLQLINKNILYKKEQIETLKIELLTLMRQKELYLNQRKEAIQNKLQEYKNKCGINF